MQVLGVEDVEMRAQGGNSLFREDELSSLEEKLTASSNVSQKNHSLKTGGSIATVLSQALVSEDL